MKKLTVSQIEKLIEQSSEFHKQVPMLRKGQVLMNTFHKLHPDIYAEYVGTEWDCFYDDQKIGEFLLKVSEAYDS